MLRATTEQPLYSSLGSDPEYGDLVLMFVEEMPERIAGLLAKMGSGNWTELGRLAHQLKGAVGSYGFDQLSDPAGRVEDAVRNYEGPDEVYAAVGELVALCQRIRPGARR